MGLTDFQKALSALQDGATYIAGLAAKLEQLDNGAILREVLPKAMEPQPGAFSAVLRALAAEDMSSKFAGFLASPAGAAVEPGTAQNLGTEAAYFDEHIRGHLLNLAQAFDDAVAQVMAKGEAPQGEQGEQQQGGGQ